MPPFIPDERSGRLGSGARPAFQEIDDRLCNRSGDQFGADGAQVVEVFEGREARIGCVRTGVEEGRLRAQA